MWARDTRFSFRYFYHIFENPLLALIRWSDKYEN